MKMYLRAVSVSMSAVIAFMLACVPAYAEETVTEEYGTPAGTEEISETQETEYMQDMQEAESGICVPCTAAAVPAAKALYLSDGSFHLIYDTGSYAAGSIYGGNTVTSVFDVPEEGEGTVPWASEAASFTGIVIESSFSDFHGIKDLRSWFAGTTSADYVTGLKNIDISLVTDMTALFSGCAFTEVDLSDWSTCGVVYFDHMFENCSSLVTIYAGSGWSVSGADSYSNMFAGCRKLKGGNGTSFRSTKKHGNMAVIDAPGSPGYLTLKVSAFSVTVPSSMPLSRSADGMVTGGNMVFVNNGTSDARITGISVKGANGWSIVSYSHDMTAETPDTRICGFDIGGAVTGEDGSIDFDSALFPVIGGASASVHEINVPYSAVMPSGTVSGTETIAEVVFVVSAG